MKIRILDFNSEKQLNKEHDELGLPPVEEKVTEKPSRLVKRALYGIGIIAVVLTATYFILKGYSPAVYGEAVGILSIFTQEEFWVYALVGLAAQMIDGALGMAYGISSTTFLLSTGVSPAAASASVHIAEVFTSGVSGLSHLRFGNVNKKLFRSLLIPGIIGAVLGAYVITSIDGEMVKPYIAMYLLVMGIIVIRKALRKAQKKKKTKGVGWLALFGGFVDAIGGGGWGPVVTSTLLGTGRDPKYTIGSVNLAEFFIAISGAFTFSLLMKLQNWPIILGLMIGGMFAAPLAAYICRAFKAKTLMIVVGSLITFLSIRTLCKVYLGYFLF